MNARLLREERQRDVLHRLGAQALYKEIAWRRAHRGRGVRARAGQVGRRRRRVLARGGRGGLGRGRWRRRRGGGRCHGRPGAAAPNQGEDREDDEGTPTMRMGVPVDSLQGTLVSMAMGTRKTIAHAPHEDGRCARRRRTGPQRRPGACRSAGPGATLQGELDRARRGALGDQAERPLEGVGLRIVRVVCDRRAAPYARRP